MKEIFLGLDLCKKNVQISYFSEDKKEPESICQLNNTETYQMPNVMLYSEKEQKWYVGNQVSQVRFEKEGTVIEDVLEKVDSSEHVTIKDQNYTYEDLLLILLTTHVEEFLERSEENELRALTIALETYHPKVYQVLCKLREKLGLSKETFYIMSHENAFFQYVMNQDENCDQ